MCDGCGCGDAPAGDSAGNQKTDHGRSKTIDVNQSLLKGNEEAARQNRKHFLDKGILAVNMISSPGSGKTTLLEKTIELLGDRMTIGVMEGDIETELDAERIRAKGAPAVQLTTGGACHLDPPLIHKGFHALERDMNGRSPDVLFIENVGNLVCPAFFDLGEYIRVALISVPEGHDKPLKYPKALRTSHALVIAKTDLTRFFDFDTERLKKDALSLNPALKIFETSSTTGTGLDEWCTFLESMLKAVRENVKGHNGEY